MKFTSTPPCSPAGQAGLTYFRTLLLQGGQLFLIKISSKGIHLGQLGLRIHELQNGLLSNTLLDGSVDCCHGCQSCAENRPEKQLAWEAPRGRRISFHKRKLYPADKLLAMTSEVELSSLKNSLPLCMKVNCRLCQLYPNKAVFHSNSSCDSC